MLRTVPAAVLVFCGLVINESRADPRTYRVGPGEEYSLISQVASALMPGDIVEVTGDITDTVDLTRHGSREHLIVVRGVMKIERARIVRPRLLSTRPGVALRCSGDWNEIVGLEFVDGVGRSGKQTGLLADCNNLTIAGCYFHGFQFKAVLSTNDAGSITIEFCEFESCGSVGLNGKTVDIWSWTPGAVMRVEHCYFHDSLNECHLKTHCTRNVIRYNWFENSYNQAVKITDRIGEYDPRRPEGVYPMHSDVVGNVFLQGESPGSRFSIVTVGGLREDESGIEGDVTFAHNLFVMTGQRSNAVPEAEPNIHVLATGNLDRLRLYNNAFLDIGGPGSAIYARGETWDTPETRDFINRRGHAEPVLEGSGNWVFDRSTGLPEALGATIRGMNPRLADLLNGDFRPRADSPLAGAGMWPLPRGRAVDLVPEYEPQRGIPADLKPKLRRRVVPPSIGPFETAG